MDTSTSSLKLPQQRDLYYGGRWHALRSGQYWDSINPGTGEALGRFAAADANDMDLAIRSAQAAFPAWRRVHPLERGRALKHIAEVLREHGAELALLDAADGGNPVGAMFKDIDIAVTSLEYFAGLALEAKGDTIPMGPGMVNFTVREPLGVVGHIVPFNHPLMFCAAKMAAPLAVGNTVIIKPPEQAPLSSLRFAELIDGILPPGVFNVVNGGPEAGAALAAHPLVDKIALIGSMPTGRAVMSAAAAGHVVVMPPSSASVKTTIEGANHIMSKLRLSVAIGDYDRNRPLLGGRVAIDGVDPAFMTLSPEEIFFRAFRHTSILIRNDKGINTPADLKGRRIGLAEYQLTANVWVRGLLEDEYGVKPSGITWVRGGMEVAHRPEKIKLNLPPDIKIENAPEGRLLNDLLKSGEIDGFIGPRMLSCFDEGHPRVTRLFADSVAAATDYYRRSGIFPIMHLVGLRRSLAEQQPWLPGALLKAFTASKSLVLQHLLDTSATKITLPFVEEQLANAKALLGADFWFYGVGPNRKVLDNFLDHHHRQGLSSRRVTIEELFHPGAMESFSI